MKGNDQRKSFFNQNRGTASVLQVVFVIFAFLFLFQDIGIDYLKNSKLDAIELSEEAEKEAEESEKEKENKIDDFYFPSFYFSYNGEYANQGMGDKENGWKMPCLDKQTPPPELG